MILFYKFASDMSSNICLFNAFKSGKSTLQALNIAAKELPEPISDEFKKMYLDMKSSIFFNCWINSDICNTLKDS